MTIKVRKIEKSEIPQKVKTYRPELSQSNGHKLEVLASLLGMSMNDVVNQVIEKATFIELISEKKNIAVNVAGPIGEMDKNDFNAIEFAVEEYEDNLKTDEQSNNGDAVGSESSVGEKTPEGEDLGKSKPSVKPSKAVSGIGSAVLDDEGEDLNLEETEEDEDEDLEEAIKNI